MKELFAGRHFDREIIVLCVRWYLRYKLSLRDLVEMMAQRGLEIAHTTIMRWVQRYVPEFEKRWNGYARKSGRSWRVDAEAGCSTGQGLFPQSASHAARRVNHSGGWASMPPPLAALVLPPSFQETSDRRWSVDRRSRPARGSAAADVRRAGSSASAVSSQSVCSPQS
jgi:hypothetical protein